MLNKLLETLIEGDETPTTAGKKRRAEDPDTQVGPSKRPKFTDATNWTRTPTGEREKGGLNVSAFKHTYDFVFTLSPPNTDHANTTATEVYRKEVEVLKKTLLSLHQSPSISDPGDIVLPSVVTEYSMELARCTLRVHLPDFEHPFLTLDVDHPFGRHGSGGHPQTNLIGAAYILGANHGVDLTFSVRLRPTMDPDHSPENALPLKISIDVEGSLHFPQIAHPPKNIYRRNYYDAWNALIKQLFPPPITHPPNYRGETDITFLYSILEPAPALPSAVSPTHIQPNDLLPSLLPFQRRSVLWMLHRERKTLDRKGQVVSFTPDHLPLFWEAFQIGGRTVYLNRVKEILSLTPPPPDVEYPGGSLNEAPGLGKTVECLALILLNPDVRRNPAVKRWDPNAEVHVREVHVCGYMSPSSHSTSFWLIKTLIDDSYYHARYSGFTMAGRTEAARANSEGTHLRRVVEVQLYALQNCSSGFTWQVDEIQNHFTRSEQSPL